MNRFIHFLMKYMSLGWPVLAVFISGINILLGSFLFDAKNESSVPVLENLHSSLFDRVLVMELSIAGLSLLEVIFEIFPTKFYKADKVLVLSLALHMLQLLCSMTLIFYAIPNNNDFIVDICQKR